MKEMDRRRRRGVRGGRNRNRENNGRKPTDIAPRDGESSMPTINRLERERRPQLPQRERDPIVTRTTSTTRSLDGGQTTETVKEQYVSVSGPEIYREERREALLPSQATMPRFKPKKKDLEFKVGYTSVDLSKGPEQFEPNLRENLELIEEMGEAKNAEEYERKKMGIVYENNLWPRVKSYLDGPLASFKQEKKPNRLREDLDKYDVRKNQERTVSLDVEEKVWEEDEEKVESHRKSRAKDRVAFERSLGVEFAKMKGIEKKKPEKDETTVAYAKEYVELSHSDVMAEYRTEPRYGIYRGKGGNIEFEFPDEQNKKIFFDLPGPESKERLMEILGKRQQKQRHSSEGDPIKEHVQMMTMERRGVPVEVRVYHAFPNLYNLKSMGYLAKQVFENLTLDEENAIMQKINDSLMDAVETLNKRLYGSMRSKYLPPIQIEEIRGLTAHSYIIYNEEKIFGLQFRFNIAVAMMDEVTFFKDVIPYQVAHYFTDMTLGKDIPIYSNEWRNMKKILTKQDQMLHPRLDVVLPLSQKEMSRGLDKLDASRRRKS